MKPLAWRGWLAPAFLCVWSLAWILSRYFPDLPPGNDSTYYLLLAKSFAMGQPFRDFSSPLAGGAGLLQTPSFLPLLLTAYWLTGAASLFWLKLFIALLLSSAMWPCYLWLRGRLDHVAAFIACLAFGSGFLYLVQGNSFMTESLFTPLLYLGMASAMAGLGEGEDGQRDKWLWLAVAAFVMLARTRMVGWAFLGILLLLLIRRGQFAKTAAGTAAAALWVLAENIAASGAKVIQAGEDTFTETFPILVDFRRGAMLILSNTWDNAFAHATAIHANLILPFCHALAPMSAAKRFLCLAIFLWSCAGVGLVWRRHRELRPWLIAAAIANIPTFVIFAPHDSFRYLMPYLPFLLLFFLYPFHAWAGGSARRKWALPAAALFVLGNQALHSVAFAGVQEGYFLEWRDEFIALHRAVPAGAGRPEYLMSPDPYFSYLATGLPSFHNLSRHSLSQVRSVIPGHETWAICGPRNDYKCLEWEAAGLVFENPPLGRVGPWRLQRVTVGTPK